MEAVAFGRMGDRVSRLGFGAWAIGSKGYGDEPKGDALAALEAYVEAGGSFIDTARGYGKSEAIIGEFLRGRRDRSRLFLCSKTPAPPDEVRKEVETSLELLGVDFVDLYYLHNPPSDVGEMEDLLAAFLQLKGEGLIRGIGASIKGPNVTPETQQLCRQYIATGAIDAIQLIFSIFRQGNRAIFKEAREAGVALVGRTVLENGFLTGRYQPGHRFPDGDHRSRWTDETLDRILDAVADVGAVACRAEFDSLAGMAIRFAYEEEGLTTLIIGARNPGQVEKNLQSARFDCKHPGWRAELIERFVERNGLGNL